MPGSLTLDMKVLGLGRQGHEVAGGVDSSPEAAQPSPLGGGGEVRLGNCALQQMVQVLSNLVVCVCWEGRQREVQPLCTRAPPEPGELPGCALARAKLCWLHKATVESVLAAELAKHSRHGTPVPALLHCLGHWLPAELKLGLRVPPR